MLGGHDPVQYDSMTAALAQMQYQQQLQRQQQQFLGRTETPDINFDSYMDYQNGR